MSLIRVSLILVNFLLGHFQIHHIALNSIFNGINIYDYSLLCTRLTALHCLNFKGLVISLILPSLSSFTFNENDKIESISVFDLG